MHVPSGTQRPESPPVTITPVDRWCTFAKRSVKQIPISERVIYSPDNTDFPGSAITTWRTSVLLILCRERNIIHIVITKSLRHGCCRNRAGCWHIPSHIGEKQMLPERLVKIKSRLHGYRLTWTISFRVFPLAVTHAIFIILGKLRVTGRVKHIRSWLLTSERKTSHGTKSLTDTPIHREIIPNLRVCRFILRIQRGVIQRVIHLLFEITSFPVTGMYLERFNQITVLIIRSPVRIQWRVLGKRTVRWILWPVTSKFYRVPEKKIFIRVRKRRIRVQRVTFRTLHNSGHVIVGHTQLVAHPLVTTFQCQGMLVTEPDA